MDRSSVFERPTESSSKLLERMALYENLRKQKSELCAVPGDASLSQATMASPDMKVKG